MKFQINGRRNFERIKNLNIFILHSEKNKRLEVGLSKYERNVMKGYEMENLILQQLNSGPKTYDDISSALKKGRSTIQSHYIPILESRNLIRRCGKKGSAWLFELTDNALKSNSQLSSSTFFSISSSKPNFSTNSL